MVSYEGAGLWPEPHVNKKETVFGAQQLSRSTPMVLSVLTCPGTAGCGGLMFLSPKGGVYWLHAPFPRLKVTS